MHCRLVTFTGATDIDTGTGFVREKVIPSLRDQKGYRGLSASADRSHGVLGVLTLWDTEAERDASWDALAQLRREGLNTVGGAMSVENYELMLQVIGDIPPAPGSCLMLLPISIDPARVDEHLASFRNRVLPEITAAPGFRAVRFLMNRETGSGITGTSWSDELAMATAAAAAESRRARAAASGVVFGEPSYRKIVAGDVG
jgi:heme-degrading monooxygenase HmoA